MPTLRPIQVLTLAMALLAACSDGSPSGASRQSELRFEFRTPQTVASLRIEVSGPGITPAVVTNLTLGADTVAAGTLTLPAGSDRLISVSAFDINGVETHSADTTLTLRGGTPTVLALRVDPIPSTLGMTVTFGGDRVTVSDVSPRSLIVGDTLVIAASATTAAGLVVPGESLLWGSSAPAFFSVSGGVVRAIRAGSGTVTVSYRGAAVVVPVSVSGGGPPPALFTWTTAQAIAGPAVFGGLDGASGTDAWAPCGFRCLYWFDGTSWTAQSVTFGQNLYAAHARTTTDVYFAGQDEGGQVARFTNGTLTQIYRGGNELFDVWFYAELSGFACGDGTMLRFTSGQPTESITTGLQTTFNNSDRFHGAWASSATNAYCVGRSGAYRYNGSTVTRVVTGEILSIDASGPNDIWVAGPNGSLHRYNGATWSAVDAGQGTSPLFAVRVLAPGRVIVAGSNTIFELLDGTWHSQPAPAGFTLGTASESSGLWAPSANTLNVSAVRASDGFRVILRGVR